MAQSSCAALLLVVLNLRHIAFAVPCPTVFLVHKELQAAVSFPARSCGVK